jgi:DNA-binding MarR family transcriptional regulator
MPRTNRLTTRQAEIKAYLREYLSENDNMPTHREIADHFNFHLNAAVSHLLALERHGVIERSDNPNQWRFVRARVFTDLLLKNHQELGKGILAFRTPFSS